MSLSALVVANAEPSNNRIAYAITRELRRFGDLDIVVSSTLKEAHEQISRDKEGFSLVIADGPSISNDFKAATSVLPNRPLIVLQKPECASLNGDQARTIGIDPDMVITRPFTSQQFRDKFESVIQDLVSPPTKLSGLFTNKACTNVFFDGTPLKLLSTERDVLSFLVNNKTGRLDLPTLVERFRKTTPGMEEYDADSLARILETFTGRLMHQLPKLTLGAYTIDRSYSADNKFKGCKLVRTPT